MRTETEILVEIDKLKTMRDLVDLDISKQYYTWKIEALEWVLNINKTEE